MASFKERIVEYDGKLPVVSCQFCCKLFLYVFTLKLHDVFLECLSRIISNQIYSHMNNLSQCFLRIEIFDSQQVASEICGTTSNSVKTFTKYESSSIQEYYSGGNVNNC